MSDALALETPYVKITRTGRWMHHITIVSPLSLAPAAVEWLTVEVQPGWFAFGARHAARKGARKLRAFKRREGYRADSFDSRT